MYEIRISLTYCTWLIVEKLILINWAVWMKLFFKFFYLKNDFSFVVTCTKFGWNFCFLVEKSKQTYFLQGVAPSTRSVDTCVDGAENTEREEEEKIQSHKAI